MRVEVVMPLHRSTALRTVADKTMGKLRRGRESRPSLMWKPAVQLRAVANPQNVVVRARGRGELNVWTLEEPTSLVFPYKKFFPI